MLGITAAAAATLTVPGDYADLPAACAAAADGDVIEVTSTPAVSGAVCTLSVAATVRGVGDHPKVPTVLLSKGSDGSLVEHVQLVTTSGWPLKVEDSHVTVRDVLVLDTTGASMGLEDGTLVVEDSVFEGNRSSGYAGGILTSGVVELEVHRTTFEGNSSDLQAGAIYITGGTLWVTESLFVDNEGPEAAAIRSAGAEVWIEDSRFEGHAGEGNLIRTDGAPTLELVGVEVVGNALSGQGYVAAQYHQEFRIDGSWFCGNAPIPGLSRGLVRTLGGPLEITGSGFMGHGGGDWALITAVDFEGVDEDVTLQGNTFFDNAPDDGVVFTTDGTLRMTDNLLVTNSDIADNDADIAYEGGGNVWIDTWADAVVAAQFTNEITDLDDPGWDELFTGTDCDDRPYLSSDSPALGVGAYGTRDPGDALSPGDRWVEGGCSTSPSTAWGLGGLALLLLRRRDRGMLCP